VLVKHLFVKAKVIYQTFSGLAIAAASSRTAWDGRFPDLST
jgi:hypothetical protein